MLISSRTKPQSCIRVQMPAIRKKVCSQCREARTRCSLDFPRCKRCLGHDFKCSYTETRRGLDRAPWRRAAELPTFFTGISPESLTGADIARSSGQRNNDIRENEDFVAETDWNEITVSENTRAVFQCGGEISTDTTLLPYESPDAWTGDFCSPPATEFGFNLQELLKSPNNAGTFDECLPRGGWLSPINPYPLTSAVAVRNVPRGRSSVLTRKMSSTVAQSLSSNHVSCYFQDNLGIFTDGGLCSYLKCFCRILLISSPACLCPLLFIRTHIVLSTGRGVHVTLSYHAPFILHHLQTAYQSCICGKPEHPRAKHSSGTQSCQSSSASTTRFECEFSILQMSAN
jgi:hypothetical protein